MYVKSFIAHDTGKQQTSAVTAKISPYDHYACHHCTSPLVFHPEWSTNRPWFEHSWDELRDNGHQHCPYVQLARAEAKRISLLRPYVPMLSR